MSLFPGMTVNLPPVAMVCETFNMQSFVPEGFIFISDKAGRVTGGIEL